ncbi:MAG: hypothetical protein SFU99_05730 [Saprospiraceae bacterium]|nr:hypothetical protein [Saprospiraceae bacterium]
MKKFTLLLILIIVSLHLYAQGTHLPLGNEAYHILDRLEIKSAVPSSFHSSLKYYTRGAATRYASMLDTMNLDALSLQDRQDLLYIFRDNNEWLVPSEFYTTLAGKREKIRITNQDTLITQAQASMQDPRYVQSKRPILKYFYKTPANLLEVNDKYFYLRVNPILNINLSASNEEPSSLYFNQRGVELRAGVDDRVYFYFNILETQAHFPQYVNDRITRDRSIPGNGFYKDFESNLFGDGQAYDFLNSQGYLGFNFTRHLGGQFGYGRNFVGNGYRSLLLSDFGNNYLYFKLNWNVWRFHYQNLFTELSLQSARDVPGEELVPKKYMAAHHLSFNVTKNFNIGLFEAVIFSRNEGFELQYLNPIILYRTIEQAFGSPDNVLVGIDAKWNLFKRIQFYGQLMMDEFKFNELFVERNGWWANKFGMQLGAKYIDALGIDHLDLQAELNIVRPYTYTHTDSLANYTHYNQTLAHPLGANFREVILLARYQPIQKLSLEARIISANMGEDATGINWGNNILLANRTRFQDYGNEIGQGVAADIRIVGFDASYQLFHNVFLDLSYFRRKKTSDDPKLSNSLNYFTGGIRMNIARNRMDF